MFDWNQLLCEERERKSTSEPDHRDEFQKDYDRAVYCTPVRRLQDKTQVFPLEQSDFVRTRLTHSLEVSTVARDLSIGAMRRVEKHAKMTEQQIHSISTIAAACGLLHDIGNPPFGHAGERAIRDWFTKKFPAGKLENVWRKDFTDARYAYDFRLFDGNAQTVRLVTKLQILGEKKGLNLSYGTLSALLKYSSSSDECPHPWKARKKATHSPHDRSKPGYFRSEEGIVQRIREKTGIGKARNPITQIVEAADDLVNATVDVEDSIKKRLVSWHEVQESIKSSSCDLAKKVLGKINNSLSAMPNGHDRDETAAAFFRTEVMGIMAGKVLDVFEKRYDDIMSGDTSEELVSLSEAADLKEICNRIAKDFAYNSSTVLRLEIRGRKIIWDLLDLFWEGAEMAPNGVRTDKGNFPDKILNLMSSNYLRVCREAIELGNDPGLYSKLQLIIDYVCGMTDLFAVNIHKELLGA